MFQVRAPWTREAGDPIVYAKDGKAVASVFGGHRSADEKSTTAQAAIANAHLITNAPLLLHAAKLTLQHGLDGRVRLRSVSLRTRFVLKEAIMQTEGKAGDIYSAGLVDYIYEAPLYNFE